MSKILYHWSVLSFLVIMLFGSQSVSATQKRFALVVGNGSYKSAPLKNPVNDASDMSDKLKSFGFKVDVLLNATSKQMKKAINRFGKQLNTPGAVGLFFFAGHGIQINNTNFLVPIGAEINDEADVEFEAINAGRILSKMSLADNGLNLIILDACRNNPFSRGFRSSSRGLIAMRPASGSLILYATEPGNVAADGKGRNGLFTEKLLSSMDEKGLKVEDIFKKTAIEVSHASHKKQTPWSEGVILGDFYFKKKLAINNQHILNKNSELTSQSVSQNNINQENIFWSSVDKNPSLEAYNLYLEQYPSGYYKKLALIKIAQLTPKTDEQKVKVKIVQKSIIIKDKKQKTSDQQTSKVLDENISRLLKKARQSELELRLTSPKSYSAWYYYSQILELNPDQIDAIQGIDNILSKYIAWSKKAIDQEKYGKAKTYLTRALKIKADSKTALEMYSQIENKVNSLSQNHFTEKLKNNTVFLAMPTDGKFRGSRSSGSGKKTVAVFSKVLTDYFKNVKVAHKPQSKQKNLISAQKSKSSILIISEILHWEDRNTFWSGKPDKIKIKFKIIHVLSGKTLETKILDLNSNWSVNASSNKPENLLIDPLTRYFENIASKIQN